MDMVGRPGCTVDIGGETLTLRPYAYYPCLRYLVLPQSHKWLHLGLPRAYLQRQGRKSLLYDTISVRDYHSANR